jgi:DNA repair protein RecO (recombination protein O)
MSNRNQVHEVLALRMKEVPSGARVLTMMSADSGIIEAFIFGGPKSKLRSLASPWGSGRAFLYHDPVRDFLKLSDFEVIEPFSGLRESLRRIMGANLIAELLIKSSGGGGDFPEVLGLARDCLRSLEGLPESRADYPLLLFIWRLVEILGLMPDLQCCIDCGKDFAPGAGRVWRSQEGGFSCPACDPSGFDRGGAAFISAGAYRWLERATGEPFAKAFAVTLDSPSLAGLRRFCFALARNAVDGPLEALTTGAGIL